MNQTKLDGIEVLGDLRRVDLRERESVTDGGREWDLEINKLSLFDFDVMKIHCLLNDFTIELLKRVSQHSNVWTLNLWTLELLPHVVRQPNTFFFSFFLFSSFYFSRPCLFILFFRVISSTLFLCFSSPPHVFITKFLESSFLLLLLPFSFFPLQFFSCLYFSSFLYRSNRSSSLFLSHSLIVLCSA